MIYSCFNPEDGLYDYFENGDKRPVNGDLPVPKLPAEINGIGVPTMDYGRPMPRGAKFVGRGWHARGMLVSCNTGTFGAFDPDTTKIGGVLIAGFLLGWLLLSRDNDDG